MNHMKTPLAVLFITLSLFDEVSSYAQNIPSWNWANQGKGYSSEGIAMAINKNKEIYLSCVYTDSAVIVDRYKFNNYGYWDALIVKYDSCGKVKWAKAFGGEVSEVITSMVTDSEDNLYVAGEYSSLAFRVDNIIIRKSNPSASDNFIMKFNSEGRLLWANTINGDRDEGYPSIAINSKDELLVSGWTSSKSIYFGTDSLNNTTAGQNPPSDIFLINYDKEGKVKWSKIFGGAYSESFPYIAIDKSDNIYLTGYFTSKEFEVDSIRLPNKSNKAGAFLHEDVFIIKLDEQGKAIWGQSYGGEDDEYVISITVDNSNNVYVNGLFQSPKILFGDSVYTLSRVPVADNFALKITPEGTLVWAKVFTANNISVISGSIQVDELYNVYIAGQINSPGIKVDTLDGKNRFAGHTDFFVIKLDSQANLIWGTTMGSNSLDIVNDMKVLAADELVITGRFVSDTLKIGNHVLFHDYPGQANYYIAKLGGKKTVATKDVERYNNLELIPNPANTMVKLVLPQGVLVHGKYELMLTGMDGRPIHCKHKRTNEELIIDLSLLPTGCYVLSLIANNERYVQKLIIE